VFTNRLGNLSFRRVGFYALILLAVVMVSAVVAVMIMEDPLLAEADAFPSPVVLNPEKRPNIVFPESVRTPDLSLNRFVDRFARVCVQGKYPDLRLMLSSRSGDPLVARRFESMFNALKQVRILALEKMPTVPDVEGPVYLMKAEYVLEDFAVSKARKTELVRLAIAREEGNWRIGPIPRSVLARLEAYRASTSQPDGEGVPTTGPVTTAPALETLKAGANRPVTIGP
jgi:hypothetical protein